MTKDLNNICLFTCTFNNNELTLNMIQSFKKNVGLPIDICILDNGTTELCSNIMKSQFIVFDNTNNKFTKNYTCRSTAHAKSIEFAFKNFLQYDYVILCDNDIMFKKECKPIIQDFLKSDFDALGEIGHGTVPPDRLFPYFCIINLKRMKDENIDYARYIGHGEYDTGCSFYQDIVKNEWDIKKIKLDECIIHLHSATLYNKYYKKWIQDNSYILQ